MTRPHSQISSMIKLYGQASAGANKVDHERWQRKRDSRGGRRVTRVTMSLPPWVETHPPRLPAWMAAMLINHAERLHEICMR